VPLLFYGPNDVFLALGTDFLSAAVTPNQRAVASYLDHTANDAGMQPLVGRLLSVPSAEMPATLASLDGEVHASLSSALLTQGSQALRRLGGRLARLEAGNRGVPLGSSGLAIAAAEPATDAPAAYTQALGPAGLGFAGPGFWIQGLGDTSRVSSDGNASGYRYRSAGLATGVDAELAADTFAGASFSYLNGTMSLTERNDSANVSSPQLALYASHRSGALTLMGVVGYAWNRYQTRRTVYVGDGSALGQAAYKGQAASAYGEAAYALPYFDGAVQPVAALQGVWLNQDAFTETGVGAASLKVADQNPYSVVSYLGSRFFQPLGTSARLELRALWAHEFGNTPLAINASMVGASTPASFGATGAAPSRDAAVLGAGVVAKHGENLAFYLDYNATLYNGQTTQALVGGLRYAW